MSDFLGPFALGPNEENQGIVTGDARLLSAAIPDESVDLIFTDPPYPKEYLPLYGSLAEIAARVLRPGGSLITLLGHAYLPQVIEQMSPHLTYHWMLCQYQPTATNTATFWPRMVFIRWKPLLWFVKGKYTNRFIVQDGISPAMSDKRHHRWGQPEDSATYWLEALATPRMIVFDPFCGGGTVPAVCKMLGRRWLGFEIDPDTAERARYRVACTQPPLLVEEAEQPALLGAK